MTTKLSRGLQLTGRTRFLRTERASFSRSALQADLDRARLFLAQYGYPDVEITSEVRPATSGRKLDVILKARPGPLVKITDVQFAGVTNEPLNTPSIVKQLRGAPMRDEDVQAAANRMLQSLERHGFAEAGVEVEVQRTSTAEARVTFRVAAGQRYLFGEVIVRGVSDDLVPVVRKSVGIRTNEPYDPRRLEIASDNLRLLLLFRQVRVVTEKATANKLNVVCDLVERKQRNLQTGAGLWTEDLVRLRARWEHRNLFHEARGGAIFGEFSRFEQSVGASLWKPTLFAARLRGTLNLEGTRESEEAFRRLGATAEVALTYTPSLVTTFRWALASTWNDFDLRSTDPGISTEEGGLVSSFSFQWTQDTATDRTYPEAGSFKRIAMEWGPPGISKSEYALTHVEGAVYRSLVERVVFALRAKAGVGGPLGASTDLLPNKRFYAGGVSSMRGFGRRKLGPLDTEGRPLGGETLVEASAELRFPIWKRLYGALLLDSGRVFAKRGDLKLADIEVATGGALMILTPIGPIRVDGAQRLTDRIAGQPRAVFHFSIGHPF